jgi:hypothetical protein
MSGRKVEAKHFLVRKYSNINRKKMNIKIKGEA